MRVSGVDFSIESVQQNFERAVCGLFNASQECSVAFKAQVEVKAQVEFKAQVEVKVKFSDVQAARVEKESIEFSGSSCMIAKPCACRFPSRHVLNGRLKQA